LVHRHDAGVICLVGAFKLLNNMAHKDKVTPPGGAICHQRAISRECDWAATKKTK